MKRLGAILVGGLLSIAVQARDFSDCFIPGETIEYKVSWLGIPLAWSKTSTDTVVENGRELIRIRMESQSYAAYSYIYKVDDRTEAIIDPETALPIRLDIVLNEGSRHKSSFTTFHHDQRVAIFQDRLTKDIKEVPIAEGTQDILSFIYSIRDQELGEIEARTHELFVDGKLYGLGIKRLGEDSIKLPDYGKVPSYKVEPLADFDGLFLRQGKIMFWVSKQNRRVVTCVEAKIPVGKISVKLQEVSGPGSDFWIKNKE